MEDLGSKTFKIPEANYPKFEAAIAKFNKKAQKLCGESITPVPFGYEMVDVGGGQQIKVYDILLECMIPKLNGWRFLARIDHANKELGNIVRPMPGVDLDPKYRTTGSVCEHCKVNRFRRDTFVVQHDETQDVKQVGSTCLKDFLGHDSSEKIAKLAELLGYAVEAARGFQNYVGDDRRYVNLESYLAYVAQNIRTRGYYYSRTNARDKGGISTADAALNAMTSRFSLVERELPSEDDAKLAEASIEWAQALGEDGKELNDYQHNIKVIAASGCCEFRSLGFAASIVNGYLREQRQQRPERRESAHVGNVGDRVDVVATLKSIYECESQFGISWLHNFVTDEGNVVKIFTGKSLCKVDERVKLRATVKKHDEYKGVKQTVLNRPKVEKA